MKFLRCLFALMLVSALSGMAKADPVDFHLVVVDPTVISFPTTIINALDPTPPVTFLPCVDGQIPGVSETYEGCASFINSTTGPITSLELVFPNNNALGSQASDCDLDPSTAVNDFQSVTCPAPGDTYVLDFTDPTTPGGIPIGATFTVAEEGVNPADFPVGTLTTNVTPEPSSIWLMSTGALLLSAFFYSRRRNGFGSIGL